MNYSPMEQMFAFLALFVLPSFLMAMVLTIGQPSMFRSGVATGAGVLSVLVTGIVFVAARAIDE